MLFLVGFCCCRGPYWIYSLSSPC